jgi:hypothetical protein
MQRVVKRTTFDLALKPQSAARSGPMPSPSPVTRANRVIK